MRSIEIVPSVIRLDTNNREYPFMSDILGSQEIAGLEPTADETTKVSRIPTKVNGIVINVAERIKVRELLIKAKGAGAIEGIIEEYVIERVSAEGQHGLEEIIAVKVEEEFLAVPTGSTNVAESSVIVQVKENTWASII